MALIGETKGKKEKKEDKRIKLLTEEKKVLGSKSFKQWENEREKNKN